MLEVGAERAGILGEASAVPDTEDLDIIRCSPGSSDTKPVTAVENGMR